MQDATYSRGGRQCWWLAMHPRPCTRATPNGELAAAIQIPFTAAERQRMEAQQFSSTLREALGLCKIIQVLLEQLPPDLLASHRLQFIGDNQGCTSVFQHMRGQPEIVQPMKVMRLAVDKAGAEIEFGPYILTYILT
jgi:hypothetical protein